MTKTFSAIPTVYNGVALRSRMEAQCAFLFDRLGWKWMYEPFSFMLPNGIPYIPDFYLPEYPHLMIECRGYETERSVRQLDEFVRLVEIGGIEVPDGDILQEFVLIGPVGVKIFSGYHRSEPEDGRRPASQRLPWMCNPGLLLRCRCGWGLINRVQWCPNCDEVASSAMMLDARDGRLLLNGVLLEDVDWSRVTP